MEKQEVRSKIYMEFRIYLPPMKRGGSVEEVMAEISDL